jgi:hypothetical protein
VKIKKILLSIILGLMIIGGVTAADGLAQDPPNISVSLATNKLSYLLDDPGTPQADPEKIQMNLSLKNNDLTDIITSKGFSALPFHLLLTFIDPNGKGITTKEVEGVLSGDPPPPPVLPVAGELIQAEPVEILPDGRPGGVSSDLNPWTLSLAIPNAHAYYSLTKAGRYSVKAIIPMRTYPPPIDYTVSSVPYERIDSSTWAGVIDSNIVKFSLLADADEDGYYYPEPYGAHLEADCDDGEPNVNPGMSEIPGNGLDDDCNPATSDGVITQVTVITPNGGEVVPSGGTYAICWKEPLNAVKFDLKYSTNNGTSWNFIKGVTGLNCTHWEGIPVVIANKKKCRVKVIGYDSNGVKIGEDISDKPFTIEVLRITSPNGGETLAPNSTLAIKWTTNKTIRPVEKTVLKYTTDGTTWNKIKILSGNPGIYNWTVPSVSSAKCKVKVIMKDANGLNVGTDVNDKVFTIKP